MKRNIYLTIILAFYSVLSYGQKATPTSQSDSTLNFNDFLAGVKYASIYITNEQESLILENPIVGEIYFGFRNRLRDMGFEYVALFSEEKEKLSKISSSCDIAHVYLSWEYQSSTYKNILWTFYSCNSDYFEFKAPENILDMPYVDQSTQFYTLSIKMYWYSKKKYDISHRYSLQSEKTEWTEKTLKAYMFKNGADPIEGIYENSAETINSPRYKLGLIKKGNGYILIYFSGAANYYGDWKEGDIKAILKPTANPDIFKTDWYMGNKVIQKDNFISFDNNGFMNLMIQSREKEVYIKLFPAYNDNITTINNGAGSGTGFAITSDGLIVTNHHVINGATKINVKGINGDFSKSYSAKIIIEDKNNDLALIKIDDSNFKNTGTIPYVLGGQSIDVGNSIFVLGYPLRGSMGDEIKLTNGLISSKSGYKGDITSYQISAPIQPGNSGGPLFDKSGNIIGIVNAKHTEAENASYAIKSNYLLNLLDMMTNPPKLQTVSAVVGKTLSEQTKILKKYVYIIEVN